MAFFIQSWHVAVYLFCDGLYYTLAVVGMAPLIFSDMATCWHAAVKLVLAL
jgi:hypothetical protein